MDIEATRMTVADYCRGIERREIDVNREYQRSDRVWPPAARSFLIETILLGYPLPKLSLYQVTDLRTRTTRKEIVDGQQRSVAIYDFFRNELRLSRTLDLEDAAGRTYDQLSPDLQGRFLDYGLSIDLFLAAEPADVREVFRRINSYTVPLNPEEQRHAIFQGPFKWFIHRLARDFDGVIISIGSLSQKQVIRMADAKLWTEVSHAILNGVRTTNKASLDRLYREKDVDFPEGAELDDRLRTALEYVVALPELHATELMKPYQLYALLLAVSHAQRPIPLLATTVPLLDGRLSRDEIVANLTTLAEAAAGGVTDEAYAPFVEASRSKTNVAGERLARISWMYRALAGRLPM